MDIQTVKLRYGIIGNDPKLLLAINKAIQVAPTDLSILITGESGVGKDIFSRIIHENSLRKHVKQGKGLISVNCGAIPEGTIESELFGHVKGAFTGADKNRKGYFEEADGGTIFLDEIGELPLAMQVKLLRVLENGEIIPVGSSTAQKINVRVVAATNIDLVAAVRNGRFREDLYYRLQQISIYIPPLRERIDDIPLLFRKFSSDVAEKYHMPPIFLTEDAREYLMHYPWYGNIRELKNVTEQISIIETERVITPEILRNYLPTQTALPVIIKDESKADTISERDILYKVLFDMKKDITELRKTVDELTSGQIPMATPATQQHITPIKATTVIDYDNTQDAEVEYLQEKQTSDNLSLQDKENEVIIKALRKYNGKRKDAAKELGISERTLYRKIKEYDIKM